MKEMPERIYLFDCNDAMTIPLEGDTEYIRKDIVDEMIKTAEDHAFFAGTEYTRKEMVDKDYELMLGNTTTTTTETNNGKKYKDYRKDK